VVLDLDKLLRRVIGEDIELTTVTTPGLWSVRADPGGIEQVLVNLCVNARDAMPRGGKLTIETANVDLDASYTRGHPEARPGRHVLLAVSDTGCGMDEATRARVFEPFFSTKGEKGTGLGLATAWGIVKQSEGHLAVYSEPGRGSTFKVYLPRVTEGVACAKSVISLPVMPSRGETVLLVEDDSAIRALVGVILRGSGYQVLEAPEGAEALRLACQFQGQIDLLITDVVMPQMGGRDLAEQLTALRPGLKVLYLSGYTDDAVVRHGVLEEEEAFLQKPFTSTALSRKVRETIDQASQVGT
jgi:two-component system cell cycle sensor histidine kinase/response regulator CckA